jgi:hypothetical protein
MVVDKIIKESYQGSGVCASMRYVIFRQLAG